MMSLFHQRLPGWAFYAIPIGFFVVIAVIGKLIRWRFPPEPAPAGLKPLSPQTSRGCLIAFGGIFALSGVVAFFFLTIQPTIRSYRADHWPTVSGTVITSELNSSSSGEGGRTYRVDIRYRYRVNDKAFESSQYDSGGTSRRGFGLATMRASVAAHRPGTRVVVHYNPANPADAMLSTVTPPGTYSFTWLPCLFIAVGLAIVIFSGRAAQRRAAKPVPIAPTAADARRGRRRNFFGLLAFAILWNGFITVFWIFTHTWCLIPFALCGVAILGATVYNAIQLFNPVVAVVFSKMPIHPGEKCDVQFTVDGNYLNIKNLAFHLEGREQVTFRQGTDTRTEKHVAWRMPLLETEKNFEMESGRFIITMPPDAMTSFIASNNRFTWHLCCRGDLPNRPDIKDEFDVTVLPKGAR